MKKILTVCLGAALFTQQAMAVTVLGDDFAAYANSVVSFGGLVMTDTGSEAAGTHWTDNGAVGSDDGYNGLYTSNAITDTSAETFIVGVGDPREGQVTDPYIELAFSTDVYNGTGNDLRFFFTGNNTHIFDLEVFSGSSSVGMETYTVPGSPELAKSSLYPSDGIFALAIDLDNGFSGLGNNAISKIRVTIGDGYAGFASGVTPTSDDSAVLSFVGAYNTIAPVPVPAAVWLFGSGLVGLVAAARRRRA